MEKNFIEMLDHFKLTENTILYRFTAEKHLHKMEDGSYTISALHEPVEMVINRLKGGHTINAASIGKGLAFTKEIEEDYRLESKVCVKVKVSDILQQGGHIYKVISVPEYIEAYFCYLPEEKVSCLPVDV